MGEKMRISEILKEYPSSGINSSVSFFYWAKKTFPGKKFPRLKGRNGLAYCDFTEMEVIEILAFRKNAKANKGKFSNSSRNKGKNLYEFIIKIRDEFTWESIQKDHPCEKALFDSIVRYLSNLGMLDKRLEKGRKYYKIRRKVNGT